MHTNNVTCAINTWSRFFLMWYHIYQHGGFFLKPVSPGYKTDSRVSVAHTADESASTFSKGLCRIIIIIAIEQPIHPSNNPTTLFHSQ